MIEAYQKGKTFLADVRKTIQDKSRFRCWWLGQSGFLIQWQGKHLLFDPYLSDSLTKKYASTDKPHVRMTEQVIAPERLNFIQVATSSHNHTDHMDAETLMPLLSVNPNLKLILPEANRELVAARLDLDASQALGLDAGSQKSVAGFEFHGIPAAHETWNTNKFGQHHCLGYIVRFGPWTVYHSGDTVLYEGIEDWLQHWRIDLALLPINGRRPERRVAGNLWGGEAAQLAKNIGARMAIPCHYEMFEFNTASPKEFSQKCREIEQPFCLLRAGEGWTSPAKPDQST